MCCVCVGEKVREHYMNYKYPFFRPRPFKTSLLCFIIWQKEKITKIDQKIQLLRCYHIKLLTSMKVAIFFKVFHVKISIATICEILVKNHQLIEVTKFCGTFK